MKKLLTGAALAALSTGAFAADYIDGNIHKNDYLWTQFNLMLAVDEHPGGNGHHDYLSMEFGGRSGIFDLFGYVDVFNLSNRSDQDSAEKLFMKFAPRVSLDALLSQDFSMGPIQEVYLASQMSWGGGHIGESVNNALVGLGSDVMVPWLGKTGVNVYALYDINAKQWDGYQLSVNWFKPLHFFANNSFVSFQGYVEYQWGIDDRFKALKNDNGGNIFTGLYWHSDRYAVGYGLKGYKDVYGLRDGGLAGNTTGFGHYFALSYKF